MGPTPIVFANGLGGPSSAWQPYISRLGSRHRVLSWDYRGLYGSLLPLGPRQLSLECHAEDLLRLLDEAGIEQTHFVGWSMGVQVGLEFYRRFPERIASLALLSGSYGRPFRGVPLPFAEWALPPLLPGARRLQAIAPAVLRRVSRSPMSYAALTHLGIVARQLDREHFYRMLRDFSQVDLDVYFRLLEELGNHDAEAILHQVRSPTLVVTGSLDRLTPPHVARKMARTIPGAQLYVIPGGTHYAPVEFCAAIAERLLAFYDSIAETSATCVSSAICQGLGPFGRRPPHEEPHFGDR